jgi:phosphatidate cytidylyltransferase
MTGGNNGAQAGQSAWRDLRPRLISGAVLVAVAGLCISVGGWLYALLILAGMAGMAVEAARLFGLSVRDWRGGLYVAWALCAGFSAASGHWASFVLFCLLSFVFGGSLWALMCVIVLLGTALLWLRQDGVWPVLFVVGVVVASDSTAYVVGRIVGGPKLAPRISPGKTRSGAVGGLLGAMGVGALVAACSGAGGVAGGLVWGGLLGVAAQMGDLAESAMKRALNVKDSGTLLPGHGGLLDRFDGLAAAAPLAAGLAACAGGAGAFWLAGLHDILGGVFRFLPG